MRAPAAVALALLLLAPGLLPAAAAAEVVVEVPGALGAYAGYAAGRAVTVDFGQPLALVYGLRFRWRGTGTAGSASLDGQPAVPWRGNLICLIAEAGPMGGYTIAPLTVDGAFAVESSLENPHGYTFLADGKFDAYFYLGDDPAVSWDDLQVLSVPQCALEQLTVGAVTDPPPVEATWGAVKRLYGQ